MLVLRMEPAESLNPSSRQREAEALAAVAAVLPVPEVYWVDRDGRWFGEPALIYSFSTGVAKPRSFANRRVTGLGTNFGPLRETLATDFVNMLARIHTLDLRGHALSSFDLPTVGSTEAAVWQLHRALRCWEEDREAPMPLMDLALSWLQRHLPVLDHVSLLHGDYRSGNFLFDETSGRITAILDWERTTIGDRHRDLAWATSEAIGHTSEDGRELLICGLMPLAEFLGRYAEASGLPVDPARLRYYTVLSRYQQAVTVLATGYRVVRLRRSHQDVLLARLEAAAYVLMEELRQALVEAHADAAREAADA
jgi:aminoglycoside phosphotransferase (APT) family kinase protein